MTPRARPPTHERLEDRRAVRGLAAHHLRVCRTRRGRRSMFSAIISCSRVRITCSRNPTSGIEVPWMRTPRSISYGNPTGPRSRRRRRCRRPGVEDLPEPVPDEVVDRLQLDLAGERRLDAVDQRQFRLRWASCEARSTSGVIGEPGGSATRLRLDLRAQRGAPPTREPTLRRSRSGDARTASRSPAPAAVSAPWQSDANSRAPNVRPVPFSVCAARLPPSASPEFAASCSDSS